MEKETFIKSLLNEVNDYAELSIPQFYFKYVANTIDKFDINVEYNSYKESFDYDDKEYSFDEWLDEVYFKNNEENILDLVEEYKECFYDIEVFKGEHYNIIDLCLAGGGPTIYLRIDEGFKKVFVIYNGEFIDIGNYENFEIYYNFILETIY